MTLEELSPLPDTEDELVSLSKFFGKSTLFIGDNARENKLSDSSLQNASVISFATHAVEDITGNSYEVGLVLTPPVKPSLKEDGLLTRKEIAALDLNNPTVILSACNTSRGLYTGAERFSGLPTGFFEAGASSLVLSMWDLETTSAKEMSSLAMEIATRLEIPIGSAYNEAMKQFATNPEYSKYSHPYYWAGFQTIGK